MGASELRRVLDDNDSRRSQILVQHAPIDCSREATLPNGIYLSDPGGLFTCANPMTDAEVNAYAENPEKFFGVVNAST